MLEKAFCLAADFGFQKNSSRNGLLKKETLIVEIQKKKKGRRIDTIATNSRRTAKQYNKTYTHVTLNSNCNHGTTHNLINYSAQVTSEAP